MKEEYIFPENNWYLKIDDDNRDLVNNWRINIIKYSNTTCNYPYILWHGGVWLGSADEVLITTEQFKQYVLKESLNPIIEDYNYLIPILNKIA